MFTFQFQTSWTVCILAKDNYRGWGSFYCIWEDDQLTSNSRIQVLEMFDEKLPRSYIMWKKNIAFDFNGSEQHLPEYESSKLVTMYTIYAKFSCSNHYRLGMSHWLYYVKDWESDVFILNLSSDLSIVVLMCSIP